MAESVNYKETSFPSTTELGDIFVRCWMVDKPKAIVQFVHGMAEHGERYADFASFLNKNGVSVVIADHMGHGRSISEGKEENYGYFGETDGDKHLADDQAKLTDIIKAENPGVPYIIFGHSMGSFIARRYCAFYADKVDGAVFCGTAGSNPAIGAGMAVCSLERKLKGSKHKSNLIDKMAFGSYNKRTENRTPYDWLSRDEECVNKYIADKWCGFLFTDAGYMDMFKLLKYVNSDEWYQKVPKDLPIYVIGGAEDPVSSYGKGVKEVYAKLRATGHKKTDMKLYADARHEIHNELQKDEVYNDTLNFIDKVITKK
jgi:alpha-beta hydrolase superfamily lysophospholipase